MPTNNRPFFANFLTAFRAHSALSKPPSSSSPPTSPSSSSSGPPSSSTTTSTPQFPPLTSSRPIPQKSTPTATASATATNHLATHTRQQHPPSTSNTTTTTTTASAAATTSTATPSPRTPSIQHRASQRRRGSDSSSDGGFRDALGGEKWYVGGRTAGGEERFYRLGMVRREGGERRSLDGGSL